MEARNSVELIADNEQYVVRIRENGDVTERQFEIEQFASAYASGQSIRLGLRPFPAPATRG